MAQQNEKLLELYKHIINKTAIPETFEEAIDEQNLTTEIIELIIIYYKED